MTILIVAAICVAGFFLVTSSSARTESTAAPKRLAPKVAVRRAESCSDAQRAIGWYRRAYTAHRLRMRLEGAVPRVWYRDCEVVRRRATEWVEKAAAAREELEEWIDYHWNWRAWLPRNWYGVGSCETGYGGAPNFAHSNSGFVSAFGITRRNYANDARVAGGPQWSDDPARRPTPRDQLNAALAHYRMHGDGWTCPGP